MLRRNSQDSKAASETKETKAEATQEEEIELLRELVDTINEEPLGGNFVIGTDGFCYSQDTANRLLIDNKPSPFDSKSVKFYDPQKPFADKMKRITDEYKTTAKTWQKKFTALEAKLKAKDIELAAVKVALAEAKKSSISKETESFEDTTTLLKSQTEKLLSLENHLSKLTAALTEKEKKGEKPGSKPEVIAVHQQFMTEKLLETLSSKKLESLNSNQIETATNYLKAGVNVNAMDAHGNTPLILCARKHRGNHREEVFIQLLVENYRAAINVRGEQGKTALHHAVRNRQLFLVKYLLSKGADPRIKDDFEETPKECGKNLWGNTFEKEIEDLLTYCENEFSKNTPPSRSYSFFSSDFRNTSTDKKDEKKAAAPSNPTTRQLLLSNNPRTVTNATPRQNQINPRVIMV